MSLKISKYHALVKYAANLINMLTFNHLPALERLWQSMLSNFVKHQTPQKTSSVRSNVMVENFTEINQHIGWLRMSKDMQLEVVACNAGGLNFPCHYMASRFISLHCVGLQHCIQRVWEI